VLLELAGKDAEKTTSVGPDGLLAARLLNFIGVDSLMSTQTVFTLPLTGCPPQCCAGGSQHQHNRYILQRGNVLLLGLTTVITSTSGPSSRMGPPKRTALPAVRTRASAPTECPFRWLWDTASLVDFVDRPKMIAVPAFLGLTGALIDAERGIQQSLLNIVNRKSIARKNDIDEPHLQDLFQQRSAPE
jgi:hypothetical protein